MTRRGHGRAGAARWWAFTGLLIGCALSIPGVGRAATRLVPFEDPAQGPDPPAEPTAPPPSPSPPAAEAEPEAAPTPEPPPAPPDDGGDAGAPAGRAGAEEGAGPAVPPGQGVAGPPAPRGGLIEGGRFAVEQGLGELVETFDRFFDQNRKLDLESPSTRLRFKTFVRTAEDKDFAMGFAVAASVAMPRLQRWLRNARLVVIGEKAGTSELPPPVIAGWPGAETAPPASAEANAAAAELKRGRGQAELRFDMIRRGILVFDSGIGVTLAWPPVPYAHVRAHLRLQMGGGFLLRATDTVFVEAWGRGPGTNVDLEVERYLGPALRLRWEGHGLFARRARGIEWSTLVGAEWKAHPRTGLFSSLGCNGFGTPSPGLDAWRALVGARQDVWRHWIFVGLEPEVTWPRPPGLRRHPVWALTARLEVVTDSRHKVTGPAP